MDALRRHRRPVTAEHLAGELSVSVRTIYRDVQTLVGMGAPIEGEAGIGYILRAGFFLPPLMFDEDELEALVLGARWVQQQGDPGLATAANNAIAKIAAAAPKDLRDNIADTGLWAWRNPNAETPPVLGPIREAIRRERKLKIDYAGENAEPTCRVIWPIALAFNERTRLVAAWCELRDGFRHFRTDRIVTLTVTEERFPTRRDVLVKAWRKERRYTADRN